ncbi:MAG: T9SS type A sorting domain-containing protein [Bacteroidales bacterium]
MNKINILISIILAGGLFASCGNDWEPASTEDMPHFVYVPAPYDVLIAATDIVDVGEKEKDLQFTVKYGITDDKTATVEATVGIDLSLVAAYNTDNSKNYTPFPEANVSFPSATVSIPAGADEASIQFKLIDLDKLPNGDFLLPVTVKSANASNGFPLHQVKKTVYYAVSNKSAVLKGQWQFEDASNIGKAAYGENLELVGSGFAQVNGPGGTKAVHVPQGSYFIAAHKIATEGGAKEYTLLFDVNYPAKGVYYTLFQTNINNADDADLFIRPGDGSIGVGAVGNTATPAPPDNLPAYTLPPNEWHRVIVSVKVGIWFKIYVDGDLHLHNDNVTDLGRYTLDPNGIVLFGDNDGEDAAFDIAEVAIWEGAMGDVRIQSLGGAGNPY